MPDFGSLHQFWWVHNGQNDEPLPLTDEGNISLTSGMVYVPKMLVGMFVELVFGCTNVLQTTLL
jgi:hypothetical protein